MEERWATIPEFPSYEISSFGQVYNNRTRQLMRISRNNHGHTKITLTSSDGSRHTRSVALMVAEAFVRAPNIMCDHLVVLDGDLRNVRADNLAWRPRWFAWKYSHQLKVDQPNHFLTLPVVNLTTHREYENIVQAGVEEGVLFEDIWVSTYSKKQVFPHGFVFEVVQRV